MCVACFIFTGAVARTYLRNNEKLFPIMALFALVWAIDVPYWMTKEPMTRAALGICTSFLTIYIGGLLLSLTEGEVRPWQRLLQNLLQHLSFVLFSGCLLWAIIFEGTYKGLTPGNASFFVELFLGMGGFVTVAAGVWRLFGKNIEVIISIIFLFYLGSFLIFWLAGKEFDIEENVKNVMLSIAGLYPYTSSVLKVLYTITFGLVMGFAGIEAKNRNELWWPLIGKFVTLHCKVT